MKIYVIITVAILALTTVIMVFAYQIEGVDKVALWLLFIPLVVIRLIRCLLLISINSKSK